MTPAILEVAAFRTLYPKLYELALAIQRFEGFEPGTRAYRNNNPGNLRKSPLAGGNDQADGQGMAVFPDYHTGMLALLRDLFAKCSGKGTRTKLHPRSTVAQLIAVWAPATDNNDPEGYARFVADRLGLSVSAPLAALIW